MPLPNRILRKRHIDPLTVLQRATEHLALLCDDDSYGETVEILHEAQFMLSYNFQQFLYSFPVSKASRQTLERKYMQSRIER